MQGGLSAWVGTTFATSPLQIGGAFPTVLVAIVALVAVIAVARFVIGFTARLLYGAVIVVVAFAALWIISPGMFEYVVDLFPF